jgi:hypothetical protein
VCRSVPLIGTCGHQGLCCCPRPGEPDALLLLLLLLLMVWGQQVTLMTKVSSLLMRTQDMPRPGCLLVLSWWVVAVEWGRCTYTSWLDCCEGGPWVYAGLRLPPP